MYTSSHWWCCVLCALGGGDDWPRGTWPSPRGRWPGGCLTGGDVTWPTFVARYAAWLLCRLSAQYAYRSVPVRFTATGAHPKWCYNFFNNFSSSVCKKTTGPTGQPTDRRSHLWAPPSSGWSARVPLSTAPSLRNVLEWFHSWVVKCGRVR